MHSLWHRFVHGLTKMLGLYKEDYLQIFKCVSFWLHELWDGWDPLNRFNHTSLVAIVDPTDRPKSVLNRCVIEVFCGVFVLSRSFLDFSVGVGVFVIGLSRISSLFSSNWIAGVWWLSVWKNIFIKLTHLVCCFSNQIRVLVFMWQK